MKGVITSNCEKDFLYKIFEHDVPDKRLDGRNAYSGRSLEIAFGSERGCCIVMQGNTRAVAQVSCEIIQPKPSRPNEGSLNVNLELSPMAAPNFDGGRMSEEGIEASRLLERCIRDSHCIDLESLCIVAGDKVWTIRVDVHVLNHDGNFVECSSIAAISALSHFKRPYVSIIGTDVTVHSIDEHDPVSINLHHMPLVITMAIFHKGECVLLDPIELEERVAEGRVVVGVNAHQEICLVHLSGALLLNKEKLLQCTDIAINRAQIVTQVIRQALDDDAYKRATNQCVGFPSMLRTGTLLGAKRQVPQVDLKTVIDFHQVNEVEEEELQNVEMNQPKYIEKSLVKDNVKNFLQKTVEAAIFEGGSSKWELENSEESDESLPLQVSKYESENESEEEKDIVVLKSDDVDIKADDTSPVARGWYAKNAFL